ncbi:MAG: RNA polymerase factor sigma-54 [Pseudomonadota bacterium]|nr:RNA polymerase factor sigma-54 [Alphaproteobacteria bacterium]MDP5370352.1 RNA polymerase factor sigma-54 [Pseudomonadota bacterium]
MMRHEQNISVRQTTELSMTPRLQQAIALLQLSTAELNAYVDQQLLENPLLLQEQDNSFDAPDNSNDSDNDGSDTFDEPGSASSDDANQTPLWKSHKTLGEYLIEQIHMALPDDVDQLIAFELMLHLDEDGLLDEDWVEVAEVLGVTDGQVEYVLSILQNFDPPGIFARSVSESLKIQLIEKNSIDISQLDVMLNAFQQLDRHDITEVAKTAQINLNAFKEFLGQLRHLQFRPAHAFVQDDTVASIIHDVRVVAQSDGTLAVALNFSNQPRVLVNSQYYNDIKGKVSRAEELTYLKEKFAAANWLIQSLQKRAVTLLQASSEIVHWQQDFFASSNNALKPMTLKEIADAAGVHESTVSRITTAKYIQTPRGMFELKSLFVSSVGVKHNSANTSSNEIQSALKQIIQEEPKNSPLSDEDLVGILQSKGLAVARRTISKYRTILGIASSSDRKRHYAMKQSLGR